MAAFGGSVFEGKHVAKFCNYYILKLHPNMSYNDAMDFIFAKGTKKEGHLSPRRAKVKGRRHDLAQVRPQSRAPTQTPTHLRQKEEGQKSRGLRTSVPSPHRPTAGAADGNPPRSPSAGSSPGLPRRPGAAPPPSPTPSRGTQGGAGRLGAKPGSPQARVSGRSELEPARGIPAERRRQEDGGEDRRPGLPGPDRSGQVQRHPLPADPSRDPRGLYPRGTPAARPVPTTLPGTPRIPDPPPRPSATREAPRVLRPPHHPRRHLSVPKSRTPLTSPRDLRPHLCPPSPPLAAFAVPAPLRTPHTALHTASDVTRPSARPRHCGDTASRRRRRRLRPPGGQRGRRAEEGRERSQRRRAAPRQPVPRARAPSGLLWLLAGCALTSLRPPSRGARLAPPPRTRVRLLSPAPSPARAPRCWPGAPSGRLAHGAVCGARRRQDVPSAPPPPPSFLPRVAQPAVWGRPRHARRRVETGQTRGRPGCWAAVVAGGGEGAGRGRLHCARPWQLAAPGVRLGHPPNPPSGPQLAARPRPGGGLRAAPRRDPWGEPATQTPPLGAGDPRATPSPPTWRADVAGPLAPEGPPAAAALPAAGAEPRLVALGWPRPVAWRPPSSKTPRFPHRRDRPDCPSCSRPPQ
ncbi:basic proline-rich protein-like [Microtus oregoni]|uniref:basic proline-rich protein-like n=1 Tax=Microtus oregoni TaxID=111838 RepID=UPI001BB29F4D|nr:basic proline-rich protein-like [Microtus oregoni]